MEIDLEMVLLQELLILLNESMKKHGDAERVHDKPAAWVALGEIVMCQRMMEYCLEPDFEDEHYYDFLSATESALEYQKSLYREARQTKDWHVALLALGRIRLVKTLFRRLSDADRQMMHMLPGHRSATMH